MKSTSRQDCPTDQPLNSDSSPWFASGRQLPKRLNSGCQRGFWLELGVVLTLVATGAAARLFFRDVPNFAPVAALALFAGYFLTRTWLAWLVPLGVMAASDLVLGGYDVRLMAVVYGMLAMPVVLGGPLRRWLRIQPDQKWAAALSLSGLLGCSLAASVAFFAVTNLACWWLSGMYERSLGGLVHCYVQAVPFFRYTLAGDGIFSVALFAGYSLAVLNRWVPALELRMAGPVSHQPAADN